LNKEAPLYGLLAEFDNPEELIHAVRAARLAGYRRMDAYTPFPVEHLAEELGFHHTALPLIVLIGGLIGCAGGFALQYWISAIDYPLNIGGRPLNSWPAFIPVTFEMTILVAALSAVLGMLGLQVQHVTGGDAAARPVEERLLRGEGSAAPVDRRVEHAVHPPDHLFRRGRVGGVDALELLELRRRVVVLDPPATRVEPGDLTVETKKRLSVFYPTDLDFLLRNMNIRTVVLDGGFTDCCVLNAAFDASNLNYRVVVLRDLVRGTNEEMEEAALKMVSLHLGLVMDAADLLAEWKKLPAVADAAA